MKRFAIALGLVSCVGAARADCDPTNPNFIEKQAIIVGEIVDYRRVSIPPGEYSCVTTDAEGYRDRSTLEDSWCDGVDAYYGFATVHVVDALKGGDTGDVTVVVTGMAVNGAWYTTGFSPGERYIFGLGENRIRHSREADHGQLALQYRISGFTRGPACNSSVAEASEANIERVRSTLNGVPFVHSTADDSLRELPGDEPGERGCWIKQRKGTEWRKVEIPCG